MPGPHSVKRRISSCIFASSHPLPKTPLQHGQSGVIVRCGASNIIVYVFLLSAKEERKTPKITGQSCKKIICVWDLSGIVSCNSDTDSDRAIRTARETSTAQTLRNKGPCLSPHFSLLVVRNQSWIYRKQAEYGFGEHGFKHQTQWVFWGSLSSGERTQWVPLSLL